MNNNDWISIDKTLPTHNCRVLVFKKGDIPCLDIIETFNYDSNEINEDENIIEANTLTEALIDYIESSTNGISISIDLLKKTIVPLKETKELIEYINALFLDWEDMIIDIYLLGEHIYNSKDLKR